MSTSSSSNTTRKIVCLSTSKPSTSLTAGGGGGSLTLLDPRTGAIQSSLRIAGDLSGKVALGVSSLSTFSTAFSSSSAAAAAASNNNSSSILALGYGCTTSKANNNSSKNKDTYGMLFTLRPAGAAPPILHWKCRLPEADLSAGLRVSPDGHYIVGGAASGALYVWKSLGGAPLLRQIKAHYRAVSVLCWSSCGRLLLTGGVDGMVHVFSLMGLVEASTSTGASSLSPIRTWTNHHLAVTAIVALPGGRIATSSQDGQVVVMEICSGTVLATIQLPHPITSLVADENRLFAASQTGTIHIIDLDEYAMHRTAQMGAAIVGKRRNAAAVGTTTTTTSSSSSHRQLVFGNASSGLSSSTTGAAAATTGLDDETPFLMELHGHDRAVTAMAVVNQDTSNDSSAAAGGAATSWHESSCLVSGDEAGVVRVWDLNSRSCVRVIQPWSYAGGATAATTATSKSDSKPAAAVASHPVTSICVLDVNNNATSSGGALLLGDNSSSHRAGRNSSGVAISNLLAPLQKFRNENETAQPLAVPFLHGSKRRYAHANLWDVTSNKTQQQHGGESFSFSAALAKRRRQRQGGDATKPTTTATATATTTTDSQQGEESTGATAEEEMKRLRQELEQAKSTIQRWESVNNKLMARLQQQQSS